MLSWVLDVLAVKMPSPWSSVWLLQEWPAAAVWRVTAQEKAQGAVDTTAETPEVWRDWGRGGCPLRSIV